MLLKKHILTFSLLLAFMLAYQGCNKTWDEHYNTVDETTEKSKIIAEMELIPEISSFTNAVKQVDSLVALLEQNRLYTVFAPVNETFDALDASISSQEELLNRLLMYHFIDGKYKFKDLESGDVTTFSNKYLNITESTGEERSILLDNNSSITGTDYLSLNGMIQVIDKPLVPLDNLYEHFLYNDYVSMFASAIDSYTEKVFNLSNSTPVSINEDGDIVYDSAFTYLNPFLYTGSSFIFTDFYDIDVLYVNITDEDLRYTAVLPTNFGDVLTELESSPVINSPISSNDLAAPLLATSIVNASMTVEEYIDMVEATIDGPFADSNKVAFYLKDLLEDNFSQEKKLSNGVVYEVDGFEYDLSWLIKEEANLSGNQVESRYMQGLLDDLLLSEGVDTAFISLNNIKIIFYEESVSTGYEVKYGESATFMLNGDFYPVDYKVMVRGRNISSGTFKVEIEGQEISEYNFANAPSGDNDTQFDELGVVSFSEKKSSTDLKFTFTNTHDGDNTGEQYLWIREIKLVPILN